MGTVQNNKRPGHAHVLAQPLDIESAWPPRKNVICFRCMLWIRKVSCSEIPWPLPFTILLDLHQPTRKNPTGAKKCVQFFYFAFLAMTAQGCWWHRSIQSSSIRQCRWKTKRRIIKFSNDDNHKNHNDQAKHTIHHQHFGFDHFYKLFDILR